MNNLLRPWIWPSYLASSGVPSTRELVLSVAKEDKLTLRRTVQVRLEPNTLRLPGGTPIFMVSRQQFMNYPGWLIQ